MTPIQIKTLFYYGQFGLVLLAIVVLGWFARRSSASRFKVREADRVKPIGKKQEKSQPFQLTGVRIDGAPHEILGVSQQAGLEEIQKAYRDLMKRYHPDKVGRPGSREWIDAQKIAEALNRARDKMLKSRQSQNPYRSGR